MNLQVVVRKEEDNYWAEVPALKGCFTKGKSMDEIRTNIKHAIDDWFHVDMPDAYDEIIEIAV